MRQVPRCITVRAPLMKSNLRQTQLDPDDGDRHTLPIIERADHDTTMLLQRQRAMDALLFDYRSLLRASRALHYCQDEDQLLQIIRSMICERFDISEPVIFLQGEHVGEFVHQPSLRDRALSTDAPLRFQLSEGIIWQLACQGTPISLVDFDGRLRFPAVFESTGLTRFHSVLWQPMVMESRAIGLIALGPRKSGLPYEHHDEEFLRTLGEQAAVALSSLSLYQQLERKQKILDRTVRNLSVLYDISQAASQVENMNLLLLEILDRAIERVEAERGSIILYDRRADLLRVQVVRGLADKVVEDQINRGEIERQSFHAGEGIAGRVFANRKPYIANQSDTGGHSIVCLPLLIGEECIGVLNLTNKRGSGFDADDLEILQAIASQTALTIQKADLYQLAVSDELTGLYVRRYFQRRLDEEFARFARYGTPFSVLMLDVDHFKAVNDTHGHDAGDAVLREVAALLAHEARETDVVARYGGEEFVVLMPETRCDGATVAGERIRRRIEAHCVACRTASVNVTVSIGIAEVDGSDADAESLQKRADDALYRAKRAGRNRIEPAAIAA
jgi:two-component system, cell cycle response regulator